MTTTDTAIVLDTPEKIRYFREMMIYKGLRLENNTNGRMRLSRRVSCYALAKKEFGLRGGRGSVLAQLRVILCRKYPGLDLQLL